ncbi:MAG: hypothetical protein SGBAC_011026 [Bacillariaceae sp.]
MWAALKADMTEFVSTVKVEATETLTSLDQGLDDVNDEHNDASGAMIDLGTGMVIDDADAAQQPAALPSKEEMLEYLYSCEAVFRDDLTENEEATIANDFQLDDKTQEITKLLEDNPDTLRATFEELTSEVEYADFWKRYYCRLSDETLEDTFQNYYEETTGPSALSSVTNFLGGAVARLVEEGEEVSNRTGEASAKSALGFLTGGGRPPFVLNTAVGSDDDEEFENGKQQLDSFDDEEELGWGDEDSDDDEGDDDDDDGGGEFVEFQDTEKEDLKEKLGQAMEERNQLQKTVELQAAEIKELKVKAPEEKEETSAPSEDPAEAAALKEELQTLKMELFEKDSELAGLKLKMEDNKMEDQHTREEISEQVQAHLAEKDEAIASLQAQLKSVHENASDANDALLAQTKQENEDLQKSMADFVKRWQDQEQKNTASAQALEKSQAENEDLGDEVQTLKSQLAALQKELLETSTTSQVADDGLQRELVHAKQQVSTLEEEASSAKSQLEGLQTENTEIRSALEASQSKAQDLTKSLDQAKSLLEQAASAASEVDTVKQEKEVLALESQSKEVQLANLQEELESTKALLQQTQAELETKTLESAGSQSTGIKIPSEPITSEVAAQDGSGDAGDDDGDDDGGDDWGDDW